MAERKIFAIIAVDDDKAVEKIDDGPVPYLEKEFGWLEESGIRLENAVLVEGDSDDKWERYINYLLNWSFANAGDNDTTESPLSFNVWKARNP